MTSSTRRSVSRSGVGAHRFSGCDPHASADDYWARRSELGPDELTTAMLTRRASSRWVVDTGFKGDLITTPEQLTELSGRPSS